MFPHENHRRRLRCVVYGGHRVPSSRLRSGCLLSFASGTSTSHYPHSYGSGYSRYSHSSRSYPYGYRSSVGYRPTVTTRGYDRSPYPSSYYRGRVHRY